MIPALLLALTLALVPQDESSITKAKSLARREQWAKAAEAFEAVLQKSPDNGEAWFELATARHALKEWDAAVEANRAAARFPAFRATALYNAACALSLSGKVDQAHETLGEARAAGFLDFDLMASDADLVALRAKHPLDLPEATDFQTLKAQNGVEIRYRILTHGDAPAAQGRQALVCFSPGGPRSTAWMVQNLFAGAAEQDAWVVIALAAPERGWHTHPSHHALEALLKDIERDYKPAGGKFHLFGAFSGSRYAMTYLSMSSKFFQSATFAGYASWANHEDDLGSFKDRGVHLIVGANDDSALAGNQRYLAALSAKGVPCSLTTVPEVGPLLSGWGGSQMLADLSAHLAGARR